MEPEPLHLLHVSQLRSLEATTSQLGWSKCSWEGGVASRLVVVAVVVVAAVVVVVVVVGGGGALPVLYWL